MSALIGNDGNFSATGHGGIINKWSAQFSRVISNVTPFGNSNVTAHRGGLWGISGSASGVPDSTSTPNFVSTDVDGVAVTLTAGSSNTLAFDAIIDVGFDLNAAGDAVLTFDFVSGDNTAFTETWT